MKIFLQTYVLILTILASLASTIFASVAPSIATQRAAAHDFLCNRKALTVDELIAKIRATECFKDAASVFEYTKKRVGQKIDLALRASWLAALDDAYTKHVESTLLIYQNNKPQTVKTLCERYTAIKEQLASIMHDMPTSPLEIKAEQAENSAALLQEAHAIEVLVANLFSPASTIAKTWSQLQADLSPLQAQATQSIKRYTAHKAPPPELVAEFNRWVEDLRVSKALRTAQKILELAKTWVQEQYDNLLIDYATYVAWMATLEATYQYHITIEMPQIEIAKMYAKCKLLLKAFTPELAS